MARKPNYDFEKRRKELEKKKKQEEKLEQKRLRKQAALESGEPETFDYDQAPAAPRPAE